MDKLKKQMWLEADVRVEQLLKSFDLLQEELLYRHLSKERRSIEVRATTKISEVKQELWTSLKRAQSTGVCERVLTKEVIEAMESTESEDERFWPESWANYKRLSAARKAWGSYLTSDPSMDSLPGQSKALRRLFTPEHIPATRTLIMDIVDGVRCTITGADNNADDTSVKISINHTLSKGLKVDLGVHGPNLELGKSIDVRVTKSEAHQR